MAARLSSPDLMGIAKGVPSDSPPQMRKVSIPL